MQYSLSQESFSREPDLIIGGNLEAPNVLVFIHGFGGNNDNWRFITPAFEKNYKIVLFSLMRQIFLKEYNLQDYAKSLIQALTENHLSAVTVIAHSVGGTLGAIAACQAPHLFKNLILIGTSPRYLNDENYVGGFTSQMSADILLEMGDNYADWLMRHAPRIMNAPTQPALAEEFIQCLLRLRPDVALVVFQLIIQADYRQLFAQLPTPTLIIESQDDIFVPPAVGEYLQRVIPHSQLQAIEAQGHFPHLSQPQKVIEAIANYLKQPSPAQ
ncbi:MAG: alpha/beta hydrolase [Synechococcus sp.]|nr:alpha/beta hydrolase [Synechococcus sp.]